MEVRSSALLLSTPLEAMGIAAPAAAVAADICAAVTGGGPSILGRDTGRPRRLRSTELACPASPVVGIWGAGTPISAK